MLTGLVSQIQGWLPGLSRNAIFWAVVLCCGGCCCFSIIQCIIGCFMMPSQLRKYWAYARERGWVQGEPTEFINRLKDRAINRMNGVDFDPEVMERRRRREAEAREGIEIINGND